MVFDGLFKFDGMVSFCDGIVISQEQGVLLVFWWYVQQVWLLFDGIQVEGVVSDGCYLYVVEDCDLDGWIFCYDLEIGGLMVLCEGLQCFEGVVVCLDGSVFYMEKKCGYVMCLYEGVEDEVVLNGLNVLSFLLCDSEGLWIIEDLMYNV